MTLLDDLDISVLAFVADHPDSTVTDSAKVIFRPKDTEELQKKDALLRHRFKALTVAGFLVAKAESGRKVYETAREKVTFGPELRGINVGGKKLSHPGLRRDYCIILFTEDGVIVRSLDKLEKRWESK